MVNFGRVAVVFFVIAFAVSASGGLTSNSQTEADLIRATERQRLRALGTSSSFLPFALFPYFPFPLSYQVFSDKS